MHAWRVIVEAWGCGRAGPLSLRALESSAQNRVKLKEVSYGYEEPEAYADFDGFCRELIRKNSIWPMTFGLACCASK